jgi:diguanylate cyclase (GGDEF)-like protein
VQGDICLRQVAAAIASQARRSSDLVCRFGGEEFAVLLPAITEMEALGLAQAIVAAVDALAIKHERSPVAAWVTVSAGLASCLPSPGGSASTLVEQADAALYRRKQQQGRHGVTAAAPDLDAEQSPAVAQPSGLPLQGLA